MRYIKFAAVPLLALGLWACQGTKQSGDAANGGALQVNSTVKLDGKAVVVSGITFTPPSTWKDLGASGMRSGNYAYGPFEGASDSATLGIFYFGKGQGGDAKSNIERWIGQMQETGGADPHAQAKTSDFSVDGLPVHWVELGGTYQSGGMMGSPIVPKEKYELAGAVVEAPQGNLFFKLTGPEKTAAKMIDEFKAAVMAIKKSS